MRCGDDPLQTARRLRDSASSQNTLAQVLDCYEQAFGDDPGVHYEAAAVAYTAGDSNRLLRTLRAAVVVAPLFGDAHFELGNALSSVGHSHEAVAAYRASLGEAVSTSDRPMAMNNLGNVLSDVGDNDGAIEIFQRGLRLAPFFTYLHNGLANVLSSQSRDGEAASILRRALRVQPTAHYATYNLANALRRLKREDEAEAAFVSALSAQPLEWRYLQGLGQLRHSTSHLQEAAHLYAASQRQLVARGLPRSAPLERDHANALREAKRFGEAEAMARGALALQPAASEGFSTLVSVRGPRRCHSRSSRLPGGVL